MVEGRAVQPRLGPGAWVGPALGLAAAVVIGFSRSADLGRIAALETFVVIFTAIVIEALPFVLIGAAVSAAIEVFVSEKAFARLTRLPLGLQVPGAALGALAFPVCECGSVPVARRLLLKGMHPSAALTFMLAAPIVNPIVLASTLFAYRGIGLGWEMVAARAGLGAVLAVVAGWALGSETTENLLRSRRQAVESDHEQRRRSERLIAHLTADFFFMSRFLVVGAALAALLQTAVPQGIVSAIATTPVIGALALMAIAFALSLCSEADAFVAVSFTQFPIGAQLAFLVFGPVVDAKLAFLYGATFRNRFVVRLIAVAVPVVLAGSLWFEALLT